MAISPAHKWGQIIGDLLERAVEPQLKEFAERHNLYLDKKGSRPARTGKELVWVDSLENKHKLDYVLEKGGTDSHIGTPVAFIEVAWRRYTKHSKNKVQEIEGAVRPILARHREAAPFFGAILAGEFTKNALDQLRSLDCSVLYFPYRSVVEAFAQVNIDASSEENTSRETFAEKIRSWNALTEEQRGRVARTLLDLNSEGVQEFIETMSLVATRTITSVYILPIHGTSCDFTTVEQALVFVESYPTVPEAHPIIAYEVRIRYNTGTQIEGKFVDKVSAIQFLHSYQGPSLQPAEEEL